MIERAIQGLRADSLRPEAARQIECLEATLLVLKVHLPPVDPSGRRRRGFGGMPRPWQ